MMRRGSLAAQQVFCLTSDQGSEWIHGLDDLPRPVRRRLAEGVWNICPTCLHIETEHAAAARGLRHPTVSLYFEVLEAIERRLEDAGRG